MRPARVDALAGRAQTRDHLGITAIEAVEEPVRLMELTAQRVDRLVGLRPAAQAPPAPRRGRWCVQPLRKVGDRRPQQPCEHPGLPQVSVLSHPAIFTNKIFPAQIPRWQIRCPARPRSRRRQAPSTHRVQTQTNTPRGNDIHNRYLMQILYRREMAKRPLREWPAGRTAQDLQPGRLPRQGRSATPMCGQLKSDL